MSTAELFLIKLDDFKSQLSSKQASESTVSFLLFKDYLHKLYLWYSELSLISDWDHNVYNTKYGHNLIHFIAPELESEFIDLEYFRANYLNDMIIDKTKYRGFEFIFIYYSIYWDVFKDHPKIQSLNYLPNPYEPVVKILLRGSHIYKGEMATIEVDNLPVKRDTSFILPSLSNDFLDFIDIKCKRVDSDGIPNQQKTNQLWNEFQKLKENK